MHTIVTILALACSLAGITFTQASSVNSSDQQPHDFIVIDYQQDGQFCSLWVGDPFIVSLTCDDVNEE